MAWETWGLFLVTEVVLSLTPGPAVLFVISTALRHGGRRSVWANVGILGGNAFYFLLSAVGLGAVLLASHDAFTVLKWCGAVYLVYLGVRLIFAPGGPVGTEENGGEGEARSEPSAWAISRQGFVLQAANPK